MNWDDGLLRTSADGCAVAKIAHKCYTEIVGSISPEEPKARLARCPHGEANACLAL
jgi:hypothetical protein